MVKKVRTVIIHSGNSIDSHSIKKANRLIKKLENISEIICDITVISLKEKKIGFCRGCIQCFVGGSCIIKNDEVKEIKEVLLSTELVIIATPVYLNNVPGELKVLLDRLGYWTHLFRLEGKLCVNMITSSNSGTTEVKEYLEKIELYLGLTVIGTLEYRELNQKCNLQKEDEILIDISNYYNYFIQPKMNTKQKEYFLNYQKLVYNKKCSVAEYEYWESSGLLYRKELL